MKKLLLLGLFLGSYVVNAQSSCQTAVPITADGTFTVALVTGTYSNTCYANTVNPNGAPMQAVWYAYTPTAGGLVTISSDLPSNPASTDTRISVFGGNCTELICYTGNDDVSGTNYKSTVSFGVGAGVTYYFAWDNNWSAAGFNFTVSLVEQDCVQPGLSDLVISDVTMTSATISWESLTGSPEGYEFEYGVIGHDPGTGTIVTTTDPTVDLSGLTSGGDFDFYLRADCGDSNSEWVGPFGLFLVTTAPFENNFDDADNVTAGFELTGFNVGTDDEIAHSGDTFIFSNTNATNAVDSYAFLRPIQLSANEQVTVTFFAQYLGGMGDIANVDLTVGDAATAEAQSTVIESFLVDAEVEDYTEYSATWTAPAAGTYYFAANHNTPGGQVSGGWSVLFDTFTVTSILSNSDFTANTFAVYPNPANTTINVRNSQDILINNVIITDVNGRVVKSQKVNAVSNVDISVSDLTVGVYMVQINSDAGSVVKKIVKN